MNGGSFQQARRLILLGGFKHVFQPYPICSIFLRYIYLQNWVILWQMLVCIFQHHGSQMGFGMINHVDPTRQSKNPQHIWRCSEEHHEKSSINGWNMMELCINFRSSCVKASVWSLCQGQQGEECEESSAWSFNSQEMGSIETTMWVHKKLGKLGIPPKND